MNMLEEFNKIEEFIDITYGIRESLLKHFSKMLVSSQTDRTNPKVMKGGLFVL